MKAPFPWFGGKSRASHLVWERFGNVPNYVEPFAGSLVVLLDRPHAPGIETANDLDGFISNFWRAVAHDPEATAHHANWPVNEVDLHARHSWLVQRRDALTDKLMGDPDYYDPKIAGYWVWGISAWIGNGWCSGNGPWVSIDGTMVRRDAPNREGISQQLPHLCDAGMGIHRKLPYFGGSGKGVHSKSARTNGLITLFDELSDRLRNVRVCCGDWSRVLGPSQMTGLGVTGVFLDPPYADTAGRHPDVYACDSLTVAHDVREWAIENGENKNLRIALCGYEGEHEMPDSWECVEWKASGGYGNSKKNSENINATRERIWFSPGCLDGRQAVIDFFTDRSAFSKPLRS